jgi:SAM-dependent methyltransferase
VRAEGILFVFSRRQSGHPKMSTDWDRYYLSVPPTARLTRRYTTSALLHSIKRHAAASHEDGRLSIVEIGGANSCFLDAILARFPCRSYDIIDTNEYGLSLLSDRAGGGKVVHLHRASVFKHALDVAADVVFSVGLVEHFEPKETRAAVLAHFDLLRPGGIAIVTFPTPTRLYRATRALISALGMWQFPDARALDPREVTAAVRERGELVWEKTLWPLLLTQHLIVARKGFLHSCPP